MLYVTLPFALIVIGVAIYAARREPHPIRWVEFFCIGGTLTVMCTLLCGAPVVLAVFVLLSGALVIWYGIRSRLRTFLPLVVVAVAIPYGLVGWSAAQNVARHDQLRQEYPLESLAGRVPEPRAALRVPLSAGAVEKLGQFEDAVRGEAGFTMRTYQLQALHERTTNEFVNSPGFGALRMAHSGRITAESLKADSRPEAPSQPGSPAGWAPGEPFEPTSGADRDALVGLHTGGVLDFVNPRGWGYVKSRDRVAGFLPHRFSKVPEAKVWVVQRIELVGLLKHPEPVVYLSDRLPAMTELRDAPTRSLDDFESAGLEAVRRGEEGFAARRGDVARFVGGIRAAKQCVECHGGERGDLLGAFSYTLRAKSAP
jgi:hypothetical protein